MVNIFESRHIAQIDFLGLLFSEKNRCIAIALASAL